MLPVKQVSTTPGNVVMRGSVFVQLGQRRLGQRCRQPLGVERRGWHPRLGETPYVEELVAASESGAIVVYPASTTETTTDIMISSNDFAAPQVLLPAVGIGTEETCGAQIGFVGERLLVGWCQEGRRAATYSAFRPGRQVNGSPRSSPEDALPNWSASASGDRVFYQSRPIQRLRRGKRVSRSPDRLERGPRPDHARWRHRALHGGRSATPRRGRRREPGPDDFRGEDASLGDESSRWIEKISLGADWLRGIDLQGSKDLLNADLLSSLRARLWSRYFRGLFRSSFRSLFRSPFRCLFRSSFGCLCGRNRGEGLILARGLLWSALLLAACFVFVLFPQPALSSTADSAAETVADPAYQAGALCGVGGCRGRGQRCTGGCEQSRRLRFVKRAVDILLGLVCSVGWLASVSRSFRSLGDAEEEISSGLESWRELRKEET